MLTKSFIQAETRSSSKVLGGGGFALLHFVHVVPTFEVGRGDKRVFFLHLIIENIVLLPLQAMFCDAWQPHWDVSSPAWSCCLHVGPQGRLRSKTAK